MNAIQALRARFHTARNANGDAGFTLIELIVASAIFLAVIGVTFTLIIQINRSYFDKDSQAERMRQSEIAVWNMERQLRSADIIYQPMQDTATKDWFLKAYTELNGNMECIEWRYNALDRGLYTRTWDSNWAVTQNVSPWRAIAYKLQNDPAVTTDAPFALDNPTVYGNRLINVNLKISAPDDRNKNRAALEVKTSVSGRNTQFLYDSATCANTPPV